MFLFFHQKESDISANHRRKIEESHDIEKTIKGRTVLLIDDDMRNIFSVSKLLKMHGIKVLCAENGKVAIEILQKESEIDLVLMDIVMPVMDGYQTIKKIRESEKFKGLPVVVLTAQAMKEDREKCFLAGASDYLSKPVDTEMLISTLRLWLYKRSDEYLKAA